MLLTRSNVIRTFKSLREYYYHVDLFFVIILQVSVFHKDYTILYSTPKTDSNDPEHPLCGHINEKVKGPGGLATLVASRT